MKDNTSKNVPTRQRSPRLTSPLRFLSSKHSRRRVYRGRVRVREEENTGVSTISSLQVELISPKRLQDGTNVN